MLHISSLFFLTGGAAGAKPLVSVIGPDGSVGLPPQRRLMRVGMVDAQGEPGDSLAELKGHLQGPLNGLAQHVEASEALASSGISHRSDTSTTATQASGKPCQCVATDATWTSSQRTAPKCVFIDLGAADGNTLIRFLENDYGVVSNCPSGGDWEALLVEANPRFKPQLEAISAEHQGKVQPLTTTAAWMCEAQTDFFLDTVNHNVNYWGSSMSSTHPDAQRSNLTKVTVNTINLMRVLHEQTIPADHVIVKMDIEGSEWDVLPCLAQSPDASLVDILFVEIHSIDWQLGQGSEATTQTQLDMALAALRAANVSTPAYSSPTLLERVGPRS